MGGALEVVHARLLERPAQLGEPLGAERRAVRLQRVRSPPQLLCASVVDRAAQHCKQPRRVSEEGVDHLAEEIVAAELAEILERAVVEGDGLDRIRTALAVQAERPCALQRCG